MVGKLEFKERFEKRLYIVLYNLNLIGFNPSQSCIKRLNSLVHLNARTRQREGKNGVT